MQAWIRRKWVIGPMMTWVFPLQLLLKFWVVIFPKLKQVLELAHGGNLSLHTRPNLLVNSVLGNLLSNAIKYSPADSPLHLGARPIENGIEIELVDHGGGIPAKVLENFSKGERYYDEQVKEGDSGEAAGDHLANASPLTAGPATSLA